MHKQWCKLFLCGICMGIADIIPGVSGGTVAFILGIYENLLSSIHHITKGWRYLLPLLLGIALALLTSAHVIQELLNHPVYSSYLFALFMGLIVASIMACFQRVQSWNVFRYAGLCVGVVAALMVISLPNIDSPVSNPQSVEAGIHLDFWLFVCGISAVTAMLLPGISGSYVLMILGAYPTVITALADLVHLNLRAFQILLSVGLGIIFGAALFSRAIGWTLRNYHDTTVAILIGFMIGALPTLWPFYSNDFANGNAFFLSSHFWIALFFFGMGAFSVILLSKKLGAKSSHEQGL